MDSFNQNDTDKKSFPFVMYVLLFVGVFLLLFFVVDMWGQASPQTAVAKAQPAPQTSLTSPTVNDGKTVQVSLPQSYQLAASYGDLGPQLLEAGAIDYERFIQLYQQRGRPLSQAQLDILTEGSESPIIFDYENAHFLLNFFWAVGLANNNPILTEGPMMQYGEGEIGRFASTGGWSIGQRPATELYAATALIPLTTEQQARLEEVAYNVYRPCCNNHTAFPDCNHGMAMLGLLQLLASQDASVDEMFAAAKAVNGFWFPQQALDTAVYFKSAMNLDYDQVDPRLAVSREIFSISGFQQVNQFLADNNLLDQSPNGGGSCGVS
jgi:hypothetical protein